MLGFRGHFSTKTRRYSTTLASLRDARKQWRTLHTLTAHGLDVATPVVKILVQDLADVDPLDRYGDTVLVVGYWRYTGRGHTPGEAVFARTIAEDCAESRLIWRQVRQHDEWEEIAA
jgi:hypothetical protein